MSQGYLHQNKRHPIKPSLGTMANNVEETANSPDLNFGVEDLGFMGFYNSDGTRLRLESFRSADRENIILGNGKSVPVLPALEELQIITNTGEELNQHQVVGFCAYAENCQQLKALSFTDCMLPLSLPVGSLSPLTRLCDIEVSWKLLQHEFRLDSTTGKWILNFNEATSPTEVEKSLQNLKTHTGSVDINGEQDSRQLQMSKILILENAARHHQIPISCVGLIYCSLKVDASGENLVLKSGLSLPILSSLQELLIGDSHGRLTDVEFTALLSYSSKCTSLKELHFVAYNLPVTIRVESIPSSLKLRNVKVWNFGRFRRLELQHGKWLTCDFKGWLPDEEGFDKESYESNLAIHKELQNQ